MKLTIIKDDKAVYKDGVCYSELTLTNIPDGVHALQWEDTVGHIEYTSRSQSNKTINSLPTWANDAVDAWEVASVSAATVEESLPPEEELS